MRTGGRRVGLRVLAPWLLGVLVLTGCTNGTLPTPAPSDNPERAATELVAGIAKKDLSTVEFFGRTGAEVNSAFAELVRGMGSLKPAVTVASVDRSGDDATATLRYSWAFPGVPKQWTYDSSAPLHNDAGRWKTDWQPRIVQPELSTGIRLSSRRVLARRGELLGEDGAEIMIQRPVVRIGIDKARLRSSQQQGSAMRLAKLVGLDPKRYAAKVAAAGPDAFVEAIVFRAQDKDRPRNADVFAIPGALPVEDELTLAPTREFARAILGTVGEATKEIVAESKGTVVAGDQVGLSGLQRRYDEQMRGTPGVQVRLVAAQPTGSASPSPGASPSSSPTPSADQPSASPGRTEPVTIFDAKPVTGRDLGTTLNVYLQKLAEKTLATSKPASALVAIRPSTGAILAAANNDATGGQSIATVGQAAPGSTFKVVSSLALLRAGLRPGSKVTCPATITVDGRQFHNYSDYPSSALGTITLRSAVAHSCNTAMIGQRAKLGDGELAAAAGSLGLGIDYDTGFPSYFGSVPTDRSPTGRAAAMIGQGKVQASPLAMAAVAASVAARHTVIPQLVDGHRATSKGKPLQPAEASALRALMRAVVTEGSGGGLVDVPGQPVIAKTGTAEYGNDRPLNTHAWMIAAQGDLAVAVFVQDGKSGSRTAGPLLEAFLRGAS